MAVTPQYRTTWVTFYIHAMPFIDLLSTATYREASYMHVIATQKIPQ